MDKRSKPRSEITIKASLITADRNYACVIRNLSENGAYVETAPLKNIDDLIPGLMLNLAFKNPEGEQVNLECEVMWLYSKKGTRGFKNNNVGLEIKNPTPEYRKSLETIPLKPEG